MALIAVLYTDPSDLSRSEQKWSDLSRSDQKWSVLIGSDQNLLRSDQIRPESAQI